MALSERLQLDPNLTLDKAKKAVRQKEAVKEQHQQLRAKGQGTKNDPIVLNEVRRAPPRKKGAARGPALAPRGSQETTKPQYTR